MSHINLSPRQKMISMMYLVLTAMLAMNVSKEVLNAFLVVNEGIENSNHLVNSKNVDLYNQINSKLQKDSNDVNLHLSQLVLETQKITKKSIDYINSIKNELLISSGKNKDLESKILFAKLDDLETGTRLLTKSIDGNKPKGEILREELLQMQTNYLDIIEKGNPTVKNTDGYINYKDIFSRKLSLQAPPKNAISLEGENISWVNKNFFNVPVVATDVILTKLQNDIYSSEAEVLDYLNKQIGADITVFDELSAAVISPKSYLPVGKRFEANIFVAASSSNQLSEVFIGKLDKSKFDIKEDNSITKTFVKDQTLFFVGEPKVVPIVNGKAKFEKITSGVGVKNYEGIIRVKKPTGGYDLYPFTFDYEVAPKSGFSVSPTKMNVLYIGLDNPLSITVSGSKDSDVTAKISSGIVIKKGKQWFANVSEQGPTSIDVFGVIDGERKKIGTQEFRVKRIPDPVSTLDGKEYKGSAISKARLKNHKAVLAIMKDFVYDVRYDVVAYDFMLKTKGKDIYSLPNNRTKFFTPKVIDLISNVKTNDVIFIQNIYAKGPDGKRRKISPIILTVK